MRVGKGEGGEGGEAGEVVERGLPEDHAVVTSHPSVPR